MAEVVTLSGIERRSEHCETCGELTHRIYKAGRLANRGVCRCNTTADEWNRIQGNAEDLANQHAKQDLAKARECERLAAEASAKAQADERDAEARAIASECWEMSGRVCYRGPAELFSVCHACPRQRQNRGAP